MNHTSRGLLGWGLATAAKARLVEEPGASGVALGNLAQFIISNPCLGCVLTWLHSPGGVHKLQGRFRSPNAWECCLGMYMGLGTEQLCHFDNY